MKDKAIKLSKRKYQTIVKLDETTGGEPIYIAFHPELPQGLSQGETPEEARANLEEATQMVIEHFLEHNLPVPDPQPLAGPFYEVVVTAEQLGGESKSPEAKVYPISKEQFRNASSVIAE